MDPYTPPVIGASSHSEPTHTRLFYTTLAFGALAALVIVVLAFWYGGSHLLSKGDTLVLAADGAPLAALQTVNLKDGSLVPLAVKAQGTAVVLDAAGPNNGGYYLISDPSFTRSNLYHQNPDMPDAGLEEFTHSASLKYDLSYDELSGVAAYVSVSEGKTSHVMVWSPLTEKEVDLGAGTHPTVLPGGFFVVLERDGKIMSVRVETGDAYELLAIAEGATFTVDAAHMKVAISVPAISVIQQFSIANSVGASFESTIQVPSLPQEMAFSGETLVRASVADGILFLTRGDAVVQVPLPGGTPEHYKLSIHHD